MLYGSMVGIIYVSSVLYQHDKLTIGAISSFLLYMIMLLMNFAIMASVFGNVASIFGATDKVVELIGIEAKINTEGGYQMEDNEVKGTIEIKDVKFCYPSKMTVQVLKGVSLTVENNKNRVVALCGTSGCGKSTIISMIERFYDPNSGSVLFNGRNIKDLEPRWYHQQIAIVQQEPVLFSGTIKDNITYGIDVEGLGEGKLNEMLDEATRKANAYNFIHDKEMFPNAYETVVGERGVKLSGGQK